MAKANTSPFAICWPERYSDLQTQYNITATINQIQQGKNKNKKNKIKKGGHFLTRCTAQRKANVSRMLWPEWARIITCLCERLSLITPHELPHFGCKTRVWKKKKKKEALDGPSHSTSNRRNQGRVVGQKGSRRTSGGAWAKRQLKIYFIFRFRGNYSVF